MKIPLLPNPNNCIDTEICFPKLKDVFIASQKSDCLLPAWIIGTLLKETLGLVVGLDIGHVVWEAQKNIYAQEDDKTITKHVVLLKVHMTI